LLYVALLMVPVMACAQPRSVSPGDTEAPPGAADQQARYDEHEAETRELRLEQALPARPQRSPITIERRRLRIGTGYTFLGLGALALVAGVAASAGSSAPWVGQIVGGSLGAFFMLGLGVPVLIAGYARPVESPQITLHIGPGHLQLAGYF
jgi:hypothetical protein